MMDSLKRVIEAVNFREPDRVPLGEWGIDHDHVTRIIGHHTYWRNRKDTTIALWEGKRDEVVESLKNDCVELTDKLDYDIVTVNLVPPKGYLDPDPPKQKGEGIWEDKKGNIYKYAASNDSIMLMNTSMEKEEITDDQVEKAYERARSIDESVFELVDHVYEKYGNTKAILFRDLNIYGFMTSVLGGDYGHKLVMSTIAPEEIIKMRGPCVEYNKLLLDHCVKRGVSVAMYGHDYCMNTGCMMSPDVLRKLYFPVMKEVNDEIYKRGMLPFFHCCGNTWDILDDFADAGYMAYQSVQNSAGMDWKKVKDKYSGKIAVWAGVSCETLTEGTIEDTEKEVRKALDELMPGGGFIFGSTNSVQYGASTDNYLKALELLNKYGVYK